MEDGDRRPRSAAFAAAFANNMPLHRMVMGLRLQALGFLADLHRTEVGQLERGARIPRADTVLRLCGSLGVEPSALFEGLSWTPAAYREGELITPLAQVVVPDEGATERRGGERRQAD